MSRKRGRSTIDLATQPRRYPAFATAAILAELEELAASDGLRDRWQPGRQGTGYEKVDLREALEDGALGERAALVEGLLSSTRVSMQVEMEGWDAYLLRYRDGAHVPSHTDPTGDKDHLRINILVKAADSGTGQLRLWGDVFDLDVGDAVMFRPDKVPHRVSTVLGERIIFSVGCIIAEREQSDKT